MSNLYDSHSLLHFYKYVTSLLDCDDYMGEDFEKVALIFALSVCKDSNDVEQVREVAEIFMEGAEFVRMCILDGKMKV